VVTTRTKAAPELRERLIDATEQVMREAGPMGVRIDEVARLAGCSRATVYRHVVDKDELVREVLARYAVERSARLQREMVGIERADLAIAEGILRTVEAIRGEWWYQALAQRGATAAVARIGGGPPAFAAVATPLVAAFLERPPVSGAIRADVTIEAASEWMVVVATGLLAMDVPGHRSRDDQIEFLRQFVAYSLLGA
jgi:AcrR family transcriptional regulator